jgi:hypothetical protein
MKRVNNLASIGNPIHGKTTSIGNPIDRHKMTLLINREMTQKRMDKTFDECMGMDMTPAQREVFLLIDEWWKVKGYGPSIREICRIRGKSGMGNTSEILDRLVKLGALKRLKGSGRSVRPVYLKFRNLE